MTLAIDWSVSERHAWTWPERQKPSDWIERNVFIPDNAQNAEPGPFSFERTPYWREVADLAIDNAVKEVWVYKANQIGYTQLMMALLGYWAAQAPGAAGVLLPDEDSIDELFTEELKPLILASPELNRLRTGRAWDETKHELWLGSMPILGLYSGSLSKLEKRKLRYAVGDEINLYRDKPGQPPAIPRLRVRATTWQHRSKMFFGSKPTNAEGAITKGFESCPDKRHYFMPCPRCGFYQDWIWSQVKGLKEAQGQDKFERANWVKLNKPAFYECANCRKPILESERLACVRAGRWLSGYVDGKAWKARQSVDEGVVKGERVLTDRVGVYAWGIVSPWTTMHDLLSEFIEAEGDTEKSQSFRTTRLALPWDEVSRTTRPSVVRDKKAISPPAMICPKWAVALYATFDTQKDWFAGVIRAWGWGFKSQLLWHGQAYSFDEVYKLALESRFEIDGGGIAIPRALLIDSGGDRTDEVYQFSKRDPRIRPTKGMSAPGKKLWHDTNVGNGVMLRLVDTSHFKSALWTLLHDPDKTKWLPHNDVSEQYCMEMASEHLVKEKGKWAWKETGTARNEAWDIEVLQRAAAEMDNLGLQPAEKPEPPEPKKKTEGERPSWMPPRPEGWVNR